jgi:hypothetical protein
VDTNVDGTSSPEPSIVDPTPPSVSVVLRKTVYRSEFRTLTGEQLGGPLLVKLICGFEAHFPESDVRALIVGLLDEDAASGRAFGVVGRAVQVDRIKTRVASPMVF